MASVQQWARDLVVAAGAGTGNWFIWPGGRLQCIFEKTGTLDADIEMKGPDGTGIIIPAFDNVTAEIVLQADVAPGQIRAVVTTGTSVTVRAAKVI